jgi:hypothetical protein
MKYFKKVLDKIHRKSVSALYEAYSSDYTLLKVLLGAC